MKYLLLLFLIFAHACEESEQNKVEKDLERVGKSVEKTMEKAKDKVEEAVQDVKHDTTVKKITNKLEDIGDRSH